jgi:hypothetical protein
VAPGAHSVYFSIFDQGDHRLDSATFLDNLTVGFVPNPSANCVPGATPVNYRLSLSPASPANPLGTPQTATAHLTDWGGNNIPAAPVTFTVTGANPTTGAVTTDMGGNATFTYTGTALGSDSITACYEPSGPPCVALDSATTTWVKANPSISTTPATPVPAGGNISDTATLSGGWNPGGDVTFQLFGPGDPTCTAPIATETGPVSGGSASSGNLAAGGAGTYHWVATYGGDANNNPVTSPCGSEPATITGQQLRGRAYAMSARVTTFLGTPLVILAPTPDTGFVSTTSSSTTSTPCVARLAGVAAALATARGLCASVTTVGFPGSSTSSASVTEATMGPPTDAAGYRPVLPTITLRGVTSTSTSTCGGSTGTSTIDFLAIGNDVVISAPTQVAPNTTINDGAVKLVLNQQIPSTSPGTGLTVNAVHATLRPLGLVKVDVVVASSESHIGNCP